MVYPHSNFPMTIPDGSRPTTTETKKFSAPPPHIIPSSVTVIYDVFTIHGFKTRKQVSLQP